MLNLILCLPLATACQAPEPAFEPSRAAPAAAVQADDDEPITLDSTIVDVTVYGGSASVRRSATAPEGGGSFVISGLPEVADPESMRVKCEGGEVVGVEVVTRFETNVPDGRVAELRLRVAQLERELEIAKDDEKILATLRDHLQRLLLQEEGAHRSDVQGGRPSPEAWQASYEFLAEKLGQNRKSLREAGWAVEAARQRVAAAQQELGRFSSGGGVNVRDVRFDLVATARGAARIELEYVVGRAGWSPYYDLRAAKDLSKVELVYRARIWQHTGEDWNDVDVHLSTAQPQLGAQGPDPRPIWLSLFDPRGRNKSGIMAPTAARSEMRGLGYLGADEAPMEEADLDAMSDYAFEPVAAASTFAAVQSEGLSVRYRLARKETIESRDEPTTVLVGRSDLEIAPEHYCVPALDATVWLRAIATNSSAWIVLPGRAAVYFGADFIGHAQMDSVQVGQEFTLHLGPDPGLVVERKKLEDTREEAGLFGSKATLRESWRIKLANHGAFSARPDGAIDLIVHETLPRSTDDRVEVDVGHARPALATGERWDVQREEDGTLTWIVRLPKDGERTIELAVEISFPEDMQVHRN